LIVKLDIVITVITNTFYIWMLINRGDNNYKDRTASRNNTLLAVTEALFAIEAKSWI